MELGPGSLSLAELFEHTLVTLLLVKFGIFVNFLVLVNEYCVNILKLLGVAESGIKHFLIVSYESHLA